MELPCPARSDTFSDLLLLVMPCISRSLPSLGLTLSSKRVVRKEHLQQVALAMPAHAPSAFVPGWKPIWPDDRQGQNQIFQT